jgi:hypothetical protein
MHYTPRSLKSVVEIALRDLADGMVHNGLQLLKKGMKDLAALVTTYGNFCRLHDLLQQL